MAYSEGEFDLARGSGQLKSRLYMSINKAMQPSLMNEIFDGKYSCLLLKFGIIEPQSRTAC